MTRLLRRWCLQLLGSCCWLLVGFSQHRGRQSYLECFLVLQHLLLQQLLLDGLLL